MASRASTSPTLRLRAELLAALGPLLLAGVGCNGEGPKDEEAGVTTHAGNLDTDGPDEGATEDEGTSTSTSTSTSTGTSTSATEDEGTTGDPPCSIVTEGDSMTFDDYPDCTINPDSFIEPYIFTACIQGAEGECEALCETSGLCGALWCADVPNYDYIEVCGPYFDADLGLCCSLVVAELWWETDTGGLVEGRPFRPDQGGLRFAAMEQGRAGDWSRLSPRPATPTVALDDATRARLAAHWRRVALAEHASVASFARFVAQLQALGAPPELVRGALEAAGDEVRHARVAFGFAAYFAGTPVEPGALATRGGFEGVTDLVAVVRDAFLEGCVAETLSAHELELAAEACEDLELRHAMLMIAADERSHAVLAWRFVAWAVDAHPRLRAELVELAAQVCAVDREVEAAEESPSAMLRLGCPSRSTRQRWRRMGLSQVVGPCAARLLAV